jgi:uncharacterized protein (UPF0276 family)
MRDRFGVGWRPELAADILSHLEAIDIVEVISEECLPPGGRRAIAALARQVPIVLHGVSLGLASTSAVDGRRLVALAEMINELRPLGWSEHLAFVRAGTVEIGHLTAAPRTAATAAATAQNIRTAADRVGSMPAMENIATLLDPPGSDWDEAEWITAVVRAAGCPLLLDLHNVHANALNFGFDPFEYLDRIPLETVTTIHLAGGRLIQEPSTPGGPVRWRVLDDHLHEVPARVYDLLTEVGAGVANPLTVILEYDGNYPPFPDMLRQLTSARAALQLGRERMKLRLPAGRAS